MADPRYETVTVPSGETHRVTVADGETLEHVLYDITADGASVIINAVGDDWTIRHVGVRGQHPGTENYLKVAVPGGDSTGRVEHCYFGDGCRPGSKGGIYVHSQPAHRGTLVFEQVHVAHSSNNGLYASGPGYKGQPGLVHVRDSYFYSNNISNVRLGGPGGESRVEGTTIHVDDTVNGCEQNCSSPGAVNARGVWAWSGRVALTDCDIRTNGHGKPIATTQGGTVTRSNVRVGDDADVSPPPGVPLSAAEAAAGSDGAVDETVTLTVEHDGDDVREYAFELGDVEITETDRAEAHDEIDGGHVQGQVAGGHQDTYEYSPPEATFETFRAQGVDADAVAEAWTLTVRGPAGTQTYRPDQLFTTVAVMGGESGN